MVKLIPITMLTTPILVLLPLPPTPPTHPPPICSATQILNTVLLISVFFIDLLSLSSVSPTRKYSPTPAPSMPSWARCLTCTSLILGAFLDHQTYCVVSWWPMSASISFSWEFAKVRRKFQSTLILWCLVQALAEETHDCWLNKQYLHQWYLHPSPYRKDLLIQLWRLGQEGTSSNWLLSRLNL